MTLTTAPGFEPEHEQRLAAFGLSNAIMHDGLRAGATRAANRSALALETSPGTDIYHDGMEALAQLLAPDGWRSLSIDRQPRLVHPEGALSFAVSSAINVGRANLRAPRTRRKGTATRNSLGAGLSVPTLFETEDDQLAELARTAEKAPFYFLLFERIAVGKPGLLLEFSRPAAMTNGGSVVEWADRIPVPFLDLEGDLSVFDEPGDDEFDVAVEPR
ncbi:hypothetical protein [Agilicoccus flavus]|uniref:hypothetical protein n=1 Tax=Agilicoccus flavus TaxID=2775968 RepID=UPI001CF71890|nr:hypothetical protein [Agilicoccus flavus]